MNRDEFIDRIVRRNNELIRAVHELQAAIQILRDNPSITVFPQPMFPVITPFTSPTTATASSQTLSTTPRLATTAVGTTHTSSLPHIATTRSSVVDTISLSRGEVLFRPLRHATVSSDSEGESTLEDDDH